MNIISSRVFTERGPRWAFSVLLLFLAAGVVYRDEEAIESIRAFPLWVLPAMMLVILIYELLASWRMAILGRAAGGSEVPWYVWIKLYVVGQFANILIPQAGNVYRAVSLQKGYRISYTHFVSMTATKAWLESIISVGIASLVLALTGREFEILGIPIYLALFGFFIVILISPFLAGFFLRICSLGTRNRKIAWLREKVQNVSSTLLHWTKDRSLMISMGGVTLLILVWSGVSHYIAFVALDTSISMPVLAMFVVFLRIGNYIVVTPGNLGVRELMYGLVAVAMDFGVGHAVLVSALVRVSTYSVVLPIGFVLQGLSVRALGIADREKI